ncbi:MAG: hypothetical protein AB1481_07150, partial [Candidatus Omnitrophota bacterium]
MLQQKWARLALSLISLFFISYAFISFLAEHQFNSARKLEKLYLWQDAYRKYETAVHLDPFNCAFLAGFADFLLKESAYQKNKTAWITKAEALYLKSMQLNPFCADCALGLAKARMAFFFQDKDKYKLKLKEAVYSFHKALDNDPNGANINYVAGYYVMAAADDLGIDDKNWAKKRLKYAFQLNPRLGQGIYQLIWQKTKDFTLIREVTPGNLTSQKELLHFIVKEGLWQYRRAQVKKVNDYLKSEDPQKWQEARLQQGKLIQEYKLKINSG